MSERLADRGVVLALSAAAAFLLAVYPLPVWLQPLRPDWLALFIIYWSLHLPERMGLRWAWIVGLMMDGITGAVLGEHALALTAVAYITEVLRTRLLLYTLPQQMLAVWLLVITDLLLCHWVQNLSGHRTPDWLFLAGSISSALLWPILRPGIARERTIDGWKPST